MLGISYENIILVFVILLLIYLAVQFAKGIIKGIILFLLIVVLGFSGYNIFVLKKPVSYEVNRYKTDIAYFREISSISSDAIAVADEIKKGINVSQNIDKLSELRSNVLKLKHSEEVSVINDNYVNALDKTIAAAKAYEAAKGAKEKASDLEKASSSLGISLKDILSAD